MNEGPGLGLHRFAVLTAGATFVLLFAGGLVTSTGSGLAVPDWPLAFGQFFPEMVGGVLFEHGHRLVASGVGLLTLVLAGWIVLRDPRPVVRLLGLVALAAVILQGVLGGITVLYKLPLAVSVTHACLAQIFFGLTITLAVLTGPTWTSGRTLGTDAGRPALAFLAGGTVALVFGQIVLGALTRHMKAGLAIPDFPLAFGQLVPPLVTPHITVHFAHRVGALLVAAAVAGLLVRVERRHGDVAALRRPARLAAALVVLQVLLGGLTIWTARAVVPTTTHLVVGAAIFGSCLVLTLRAAHLLARPRRAPAVRTEPARALA
jgi:cytochrome c oxidase assembly protein subunit 15